MASERFGPGIPEEWRLYDHLDLLRYRFTTPHVGGRRVLDLACGTGYGSHALRTLGAREVVGVDLSEEAITYARKNYVREGVGYEIGDALTWKSSGAQFDVVISFETIVRKWIGATPSARSPVDLGVAFQEASTDIQPLLPERRAACDVFFFICRRKP